MKRMSEIDKLKRALDADRAMPRPGAREAAVAAALEAFDAEHAATPEDARQGTGLLGRLRNAARAASETITGRRPMHSLSMRQALAGGASLAVLTIAVVAAVNVQTIEGFMQRDTGAKRERDYSQIATRLDEGDGAAGRQAAAEPEIAQNNLPRVLSDSDATPAPDTPAPQPSTRGDDVGEILFDLSQRGMAGAPPRDRVASSAPMGSAVPMAGAEMPAPPAYEEQGRDRFETIDTNPLHVTAEDPVSTFSIDVDTSSYAFMRAAINNGTLPPDDAVRVEELINYFPYDYAGPDSAEEPFRATATVMPTPWNAETRLLHIGIKGFDLAPAERPRANLVFLIDTSGSMDAPNKLPLLINSMRLLVDELGPEDRVAIVAYAGGAGTVLEPTAASEKSKILAALESLGAGGSTAGAEGIRQAYQLARESFDADGVNRVILATDGDFNVGITDADELQGFVERERESGVFLSVLGFGQGNYNDALMQALAQNGNGAAAYIDTLNEARKVLVEEASSTLFPIAKDVKIQVEFNPATVSEYRLIGYENRLLNREDFNNDRVDAGEIGSGHSVTAIYEITPAGSPAELVDGLRYQREAPSAGDVSDEYAFLRIRYKLPEEDTSRLIETPVSAADEVDASTGGTAAREARFAAAVAAFGQLMRGGQYTGDFTYDDVIALAQANKGPDEFGYRAEFINLARLAGSAASMQRLRP
jgi:Ca-activated chloride channel family protein